jgi:Bap31/Bap29 transmembrane region
MFRQQRDAYLFGFAAFFMLLIVKLSSVQQQLAQSRAEVAQKKDT